VCRNDCAKMGEPILTIYMSYAVFLHKEVPFWGCDMTAVHLGIDIPQKPLFWGVNSHFQVKLVKYQHLHIIKTTALITTKFYTVTNTTKYSSWVVAWFNPYVWIGPKVSSTFFICGINYCQKNSGILVYSWTYVIKLFVLL